MNGLRLILVTIAALGLAGSIGFHVAEILGSSLPGSASILLFLGIFLVWVPAVIELIRFAPAMRSVEVWRLILAGAPHWLRWTALVALVYAFLNFILATGQVSGTVTSASPAFGRVMTGHAIAFYAMALLILYAAHRRAESGMVWRCSAGHQLDQPVVSCPRCGKRVAAALPDAGLGV